MKRIEHIVTGEQGIHARNAVILVSAAKKYSSDMLLWAGGRSANLKNMFELIKMQAEQGTTIRCEISGADEEKAAKEIAALIEKL
ncbi:MAG: HPr family phosphocarrier protein [Eubacteriales bacterium]|nr:HPr family phosphocarrier protein [Eubacteriales bacterium]